jgi:hypothetical protein
MLAPDWSTYYYYLRVPLHAIGLQVVSFMLRILSNVFYTIVELYFSILLH